MPQWLGRCSDVIAPRKSETCRKKATRWWTSRRDRKSAFTRTVCSLLPSKCRLYTFTYVSFNARCLVRALWIIYNILEPVREKNSRTRMKIVIDAAANFMRLRSWMVSIFIYLKKLYSCSHVIFVSSVYTHFSRWRKFLATLTIFRMRVIVTVHSRFAVFRIVLKIFKRWETQLHN